MTIYVGKPSAVGRPTRPTQPFIPSGSRNEWQAAIVCLLSQLGVAPLVNAYKGKAGTV